VLIICKLIAKGHEEGTERLSHHTKTYSKCLLLILLSISFFFLTFRDSNEEEETLKVDVADDLNSQIPAPVLFVVVKSSFAIKNTASLSHRSFVIETDT
jgi:hypothetical protein